LIIPSLLIQLIWFVQRKIHRAWFGIQKLPAARAWFRLQNAVALLNVPEATDYSAISYQVAFKY
jgi:hypothetical protein